jgi:hypothetical protein
VLRSIAAKLRYADAVALAIIGIVLHRDRHTTLCHRQPLGHLHQTVQRIIADRLRLRGVQIIKDRGQLPVRPVPIAEVGQHHPRLRMRECRQQPVRVPHRGQTPGAGGQRRAPPLTIIAKAVHRAPRRRQRAQPVLGIPGIAGRTYVAAV